MATAADVTLMLLLLVLTSCARETASEIVACDTETSTVSLGAGSTEQLVSRQDRDSVQTCRLELKSCDSCKLNISVVSLNFPPCDSHPSQFEPGCYEGCPSHITLHEPAYYKTAYAYLYPGSVDHYTSITKDVFVEICMDSESNFTLQIEVVEKKEIFTGKNQESKFLASERFPQGYVQSGDVYSYVIRSLDNSRIRIWFTDWLLANGSTVTIYDHYKSASNLRANVTASSPRPVLQSSGDELLVVFSTGTAGHLSTDLRKTFVGFRARYNFTTSKKWSELPRINTYCGGYFHDWGGWFALNTSHCHSSELLDCVWVVQRYRGSENSEYLRVELFNVLLDAGDFLEIRSGNSSVGDLIRTNADTVSPGADFVDPEAFYIHLRLPCSKSRIFNVSYVSYDNAEMNGHQLLYCPNRQHRPCNNGHCIPSWLLCDGIDHCGDHTDEADCHKNKDYHPCNGYFPCNDNDGFYCSSTKCDQKYDCKDGSDEKDCWAYTPATTTRRTPSDHFYWGTITPVILICLILGIVTCVVVSYYVRRKRMLNERARRMRMEIGQPAVVSPQVDFTMPPSYEESIRVSYIHPHGNINFGYDGNYDHSWQDSEVLPPPYTPKYENPVSVRGPPGSLRPSCADGSRPAGTSSTHSTQTHHEGPAHLKREAVLVGQGALGTIAPSQGLPGRSGVQGQGSAAVHGRSHESMPTNGSPHRRPAPGVPVPHSSQRIRHTAPPRPMHSNTASAQVLAADRHNGGVPRSERYDADGGRVLSQARSRPPDYQDLVLTGAESQARSDVTGSSHDDATSQVVPDATTRNRPDDPAVGHNHVDPDYDHACQAGDPAAIHAADSSESSRSRGTQASPRSPVKYDSVPTMAAHGSESSDSDSTQPRNTTSPRRRSPPKGRRKPTQSGSPSKSRTQQPSSPDHTERRSPQRGSQSEETVSLQQAGMPYVTVEESGDIFV